MIVGGQTRVFNQQLSLTIMHCSRLLPKKKIREPSGLLMLQVGSPSHDLGSPNKK